MNWKKIAIISAIVVGLLVIVGFTIAKNQQGVIAVQIGTVKPEDLASVVTASGEIKPKTYVNVGANAFGRITHLYVKEGDHVKLGQTVAQLENVQPASNVAQMRASLDASRTDEQAAEAAQRTATADLNSARADYQMKRLDYDRATGLYKDALIAKSEFDSREAAFKTSDANVAQAEARLAQAKAQRLSATGHVHAAQANLTGASDLLSKTIYIAPFDGVVTNVPVREGETVVVGIQNSPGSTLMTIADLSIITAEVHVDETDIVNVKLGQPAEVTIDAIPNKTFHGTVTEIGNNAIIRSTGVATTQSTTGSEEAKDFKVVVTLSDPPANLRPGLSTTTKITTATRANALAVPIQALTVRTGKDLLDDAAKKASAKPGNEPSKEEQEKLKKEITGVFVVKNGKANFVPVNTGVTGTTDIEVLDGLKSGDQIVTGSYKVLRSLRNGAKVKQEKVEIKKDEES